MLQSAKSNAVRNRGTVAFACLVAACAIAACSSSESPAPAPAVALGGSGFGGAAQPQNGGSTQAQTGGASNNSNTGGASNNSNTGGASNNSNTGGASNNSNTGGSSNNSNTGGASNNSNTGGTSNNSNTGGTSNNSNTGGASTDAGGSSSIGGVAQAGGTTSGGGAGGAVACLPVTKALISDFTYTAGGSASTSDGSFGDYTTTFSGGTFVYPASATALVSDVTQSNWHIRGNVTDYAGFGLYNGKGCGKIDASAYKGISFVISGTVTTGVTATANTLTMTVGTAADTITATWLNANKATGEADVANFGRCTPTTNKWDGTCASPSKLAIPVTTTPTPVTVLWADLTGGKPDASVTASELTSISWVLPNPTGVGTTSVVPYPVDIVIDDIQFVQ